MIIKDPDDLTADVIAVMRQTKDARLRKILVSLAKHLHSFVRDVELTEEEFRAAAVLIARLGQQTTDKHNEVVLMAGSLGVSTLVCLLNNGNNSATETSASLLGPFWRLNSPPAKNGDSLLRSDTPGPPMIFTGKVRDQDGHPVAGASVDIWHSSPVGFYENQDPEQADMNLRGKFTTDAFGKFWFRSVKPAGYPIPTDGIVGELLEAQSRHRYRPAHVHSLIFKPGFKTLISQVYLDDDPHLLDDVQFGVTRALIGDLKKHDGKMPGAPEVAGPWYSLDYTFTMEPGAAKLPVAPIT